jgi:hypothetical protein
MEGYLRIFNAASVWLGMLIPQSILIRTGGLQEVGLIIRHETIVLLVT